MKKYLLIVTSLCLAILSNLWSLEFCKESDHFIVFACPQDYNNLDAIIAEEEAFYKKLSEDFQHLYSSKIILEIYPDITSFHQAINFPDAPDWIIGQTSDHKDMRVSPYNPGSYHTYDSVMSCYKVGLTTLFINDAFHNTLPRWLCQGIALYKAGLYNPTRLTHLLTKPSEIPTLEELEVIDQHDTLLFNRLHGFIVAPALVAYLDQKFGWSIIIELLQNYANFETIIGLSKNEFRNQWLHNLNTLQESA